MTENDNRPPSLPERIKGLVAIAANLAWSWDPGARELFARIDRTLWSLTRHNPLALIQRVDPERLAKAASDQRFLELYDEVVERMSRLSSSAGTWFATQFSGLNTPPVAYFCAEFALHNSVPIYSGGLGILAGDHLKAASDLGVPLVGVGLLYTRGYFDQRLRSDGWQEDSADQFDPATTPLSPILGPDGAPYVATVIASGRQVYVGAWRMIVGRVPVYLLDTNLEQNDRADREILHQLYAGHSDLRLLQEWILGVGGVRVLRALGIHPIAWHANEGHAAFMLVERVRELASQGLPFGEAIRRVRVNSVFTTHTPVPAGHDVFSREQLLHCVGRYWDELGIERETFLGLGHYPTRDHGTFHMTVAAIQLSGQVNGVSARHGDESRVMWRDLWPEREPERVPIRHVTNGVHLGTWMSNPMRELLDGHLGGDWPARVDEPALWQEVLAIDDAELWAVHTRTKRSLLGYIREDARRRWRFEWRDVVQLASAGTVLASGALTIGFARRFTGYKRPDLIFHDPDRLRALLVNPWRPVQLIFAGKAHPADEQGKRLLQRVYSFTRDPAFEGRIAFLEDYELHLAHRLVRASICG
ncbi:MAG: alpha-glucan family phosphorylase [Gemmatimonadetes bacterium]|nr:alpha-glucan family phosphorylase [Gemmatimonadota bacterium]